MLYIPKLLYKKICIIYNLSKKSLDWLNYNVLYWIRERGRQHKIDHIINNQIMWIIHVIMNYMIIILIILSYVWCMLYYIEEHIIFVSREWILYICACTYIDRVHRTNPHKNTERERERVLYIQRNISIYLHWSTIKTSYIFLILLTVPHLHLYIFKCN